MALDLGSLVHGELSPLALDTVALAQTDPVISGSFPRLTTLAQGTEGSSGQGGLCTIVNYAPVMPFPVSTIPTHSYA